MYSVQFLNNNNNNIVWLIDSPLVFLIHICLIVYDNNWLFADYDKLCRRMFTRNE